MIEKGNVYWYRIKKEYYYCAVLEITRGNDYLIAISEKIGGGKIVSSLEAAEESELYTIAWFDDWTVLPLHRLHFVAKVIITDNYNNRAGIWIDDTKHVNQNPGNLSTWRHEGRNYAIKGINIKDTFTTYYIPKTHLNNNRL